MSPKKSAKLALTQAALASINALDQCSVENWGKKVAGRYLDNLEDGLLGIQEQPDLLRSQSNFHPALCFYRVNKLLFVCDRQANSIIVLAVVQATQDIPVRLAELEPTLTQEVELIHKKRETANPQK
ncbi:hypothetical protein FF011L_29970 [Roseimaritima multifibrata]|uniref:Plasmid stabilization system protein n=1 Tax=Roseimaritima multifibrata TaxID=1930274 RepID=A0A517MH61_9BACT|nr:type II toxin-antitoxin system RelE/ParE family toxin [Roseimaritima multifibrata]QDS94218.1 hypothetical protein FF011L_29970 [Roseimaritima multifibrata]